MRSFLRVRVSVAVCVVLSLVCAAAVKSQPVFSTVAPTAASVGTAYSYTMAATDVSGGAVGFSAPVKPSWLTLGTSQLTAAQFSSLSAMPSGVAMDASNNLYVAAQGGTAIYKITPAGTVTTFFNHMSGDVYYMHVYNGDLYCSYYNNNVTGKSSIYKINLASPVSETLVYTASTNGQGVLMGLSSYGGFLYVAAYGTSKILKVNPANGTATNVFSFTSVSGLTVSPFGMIYAVGINTGSVLVYNIATEAFSSSSLGLNAPMDIKVDGNNNIYISGPGFVRKYDSNLSSFTNIYSPVGNAWGLAITPGNIVYFGDDGISKVFKVQNIATLAGTPAAGNLGNNSVTLRASNGTTTTDQSYTIVVTAPPTISAMSNVNKTVGDAAFTITNPTSNSSGAFSYASNNTSVASVSGNTVTVNGAGTATITATQAANGFYTSGTQTFIVTVAAVSGPVGINNGILMWLDASNIDGDGVAGNDPATGTSLGIWKDRSGKGNNATTLAGQNNITYVTNQVNGKPVARFARVSDALGSVLQAANVDIRASANPAITMFTVYKQGTHASDGGQGQALWGNDDGDWDRFFYSSWAFGNNGIVSLGLVNPTYVDVTGAGSTGVTQLMTAVYNNGVANGSNIYFNGGIVNTFTDNTNSNSQPSLRIGNDGDNGSFNGDIAEFIVYNRKLTDCEIQQVNGYLAGKYGVTFTSATITPAGASAICAQGTLTMTASSGSAYQWYRDGVAIPAATSNTYGATVSGTYTVAVASAGGCSSTSAGKVVNVNPLPALAVTSNSPVNIGGTIAFTATGAASYSWTGPNLFTSTSANPSLTAGSTAVAGLYTVTGTSATGCTAVVSARVTVNSAAGALAFDGAGSYVTLGSSSLLKPTGALTAEAWVRRTNWGTPALQTILGNTDGNGYSIIISENGGFSNAGTNITALVRRNGAYAIVSWDASSLASGWHHIALTYDGRNTILYVDGTQKNQNDAGGNYPVTYNANNSTFIGAEVGNADLPAAIPNYFDGSIDEARFWNKALCAQQVANNISGEIASPQSGLVAYYKFNQGFVNANNASVATLTDLSGNNLTGSLMNFALAGATSNWVAGNVSGNAAPFVPASGTVGGISTVCTGATTALSTTLTAGTWSSSNGAVASVNTSGVVSSLSAGTSVITYTTLCGSVASLTVTVNTTPTAGIAKTDVICGNDATITVTGGAGATPYQFSKDGGANYQSSNVFSALTTGTYNIVVKAASGCASANTPVVIGNAARPEINITGNGVAIVKGDATPVTGDNTNFGGTTPGVAVSKTFVVQNTGTAALTLSSYTVTGTNASDFTVGGLETAVSVPAGGSVNLTVLFNPAAVGTKNAVVAINNSDCDEASYDFAVTGSVTCVAPSFANSNLYIQHNTASGTCDTTVTYPLSVSGSTPVVTYTFTGATTGTGSGTGSGKVFNTGVTHVVVNATNACGSTSTSFDVTVVDNVKPVALVKNVTIYLGANGLATVTAAQLDNGSYDNCGAVTLSVNNTGYVCGTAAENGTIFMQAPAGAVFTSIDFASYGTPTGSCGNFTLGSCHATGSAGIVGGILLGNNSGTINATNGVFGDPCNGTVKNLSIQATYESVGGATSNTFNCSKLGANNLTVIVTDAAGNAQTATAIVTVLDTTRPVVNTKDVALCLDANGNASITTAMINNGSTDNCGIASISLDKTTFNSSNVGANIVTLSVTDVNGNVGTKTATVTINALPVAYTVTGGGAYCAGGTGVVVGLSNSQSGVNYQLRKNNANLGAALAGTGSALSFGVQLTAGSYSISATNASTGCASNMSGTATVVVNPLPGITITPAATTICAGGAVTLTAAPATTKTYTIALANLLNTPSNCGTGGMYGSGANQGFTWVDAGSGTVTNVNIKFTTGVNCNSGLIRATSLNGVAGTSFTAPYNCSCTPPASGNLFSLNFGATGYVVGGTNTFSVTTSGSQFGFINNNTVDLGGYYAVVTVTYSGVGTSWSWAPGGQTTASINVNPASTTTYTVTGTDANGCKNTASSTITVNPLPTQFNVTGGGNACNGAGVPVGLNGSETGVRYQLRNGSTNVGSPVNGTGSSISFGNQATAANYTVLATNTSSGCTNMMAGNAVVTTGTTPSFANTNNSVQSQTTSSGCNATVAYPLTVSGVPGVNVTYAFTGATTGSGNGTGSGSVFEKGITNVSVTATNTCGTVTYNFTVTVTDATAPVPNQATLATLTGECSVVATAPVATDNCAGVVTATTTDPLVYNTQGTYTITWTYNDGNNNISTQTQTVIVKDVTPPVISPATNVTTVNTAGQCSAIVTIPSPAVTDNCGTTENIILTNNITGTPDASGVYQLGTTTVIWTATDIAGNTSTFTQTVTVQSAEVDVKGNNVSIVKGDGTASATDNTDFGGTLPSIPVVRSFTIANNGTAPLTVSSVNVSGSDAANFTVSGITLPVVIPAGSAASFDVTFNAISIGVKNATLVVNNSDCDEASYDFAVRGEITCSMPVFNNITASIAGFTPANDCATVINYGLGATGAPTPSLAYAFSGAKTGIGAGSGSGTAFNKGTTHVTVTATNACGTVSNTFTVIITDNIAPTITAAADIFVNNDAGSCAATVAPGVPATADNCGVATVTGVRSDGLALDAKYPVGTTSITWTVTDNSGLTATATQTVTVADNEKPVIVSPETIAVNSDAAKCGAHVNIIAPASTDNCGVQSTTGVRSDGLLLTDDYPVGTTTITWTVTDIHGNTQTAIQTIVVNDTEKPVITAPAA
ncbi:choice-of-anchor D domain-containing protein, partial [Sediminibacterium roseum]